MPRHLEVNVSTIGHLDLREYKPEPCVYGGFRIPSRFFREGADQLTREQFAEMLVREFEAGIQRLEDEVNEYHANAGRELVKLPFSYKQS